MDSEKDLWEGVCTPVLSRPLPPPPLPPLPLPPLPKPLPKPLVPMLAAEVGVGQGAEMGCSRGDSGALPNAPRPPPPAAPPLPAPRTGAGVEAHGAVVLDPNAGTAGGAEAEEGALPPIIPGYVVALNGGTAV